MERKGQAKSVWQSPVMCTLNGGDTRSNICGCGVTCERCERVWLNGKCKKQTEMFVSILRRGSYCSLNKEDKNNSRLVFGLIDQNGGMIWIELCVSILCEIIMYLYCLEILLKKLRDICVFKTNQLS